MPAATVRAPPPQPGRAPAGRSRGMRGHGTLRAAIEPFIHSFGVIAGQVLVPPAKEVVDQDAQHDREHYSNAGAEQRVVVKPGKELARIPMPMEYPTQVKQANASSRKNRRCAKPVLPAT
ncbi:hypothetical protein AHiyo4_13350 [Arthrobacter sp. Hiyo4]|nr:hypothetical protein AHiyo4_13350 [Arthrobacter sp. Hiyo4]